MRFLAALAVFGVIALLVVRLPKAGLPLALAVGVLVPLQANGVFTGVRYSSASAVFTILPMTWIVCAAAAVAVLLAPAHLTPASLRVPGYALPLLAFAGLATAMTVLDSNGYGKVFFVSTVAAPLLWFLLVRLAAGDRSRPGRAPLAVLADTVIVLGLVQAVIALVQRFARSSLVFVSQYRSETWYVPDAGTAYRSTGTLDHPLNLALLLLLVIGLLLRRRPTWWTLVGVVLAVAGVAASASRSGIVAAVALVATAAVSRRFSGLRRLAVLAVLALGGLLVLRSPVGEVLIQRYTTDVSSLSIRSNAYAEFGRVWLDYLPFGSGPGTSYDLAERLLFRQGSLEQPWFMHAVDYGLLAAVALVAGIVACVLTRGRDGYLDRTAILALAAMVSTYSSLATPSLSPYLFFTALALFVGEPQPADPPSDPPAEDAEPYAAGTVRDDDPPVRSSGRRTARDERNASSRPGSGATAGEVR